MKHALMILSFTFNAAMVCLPAPAVADDAARGVIGEVMYAAEKRDLELLAGNMAERFRYSFGDGYSKQLALEQFKREPKLLTELARVISLGCGPGSDPPVHDYVCPHTFANSKIISFGHRAGFSRGKDGVWRFDYFVEGD